MNLQSFLVAERLTESAFAALVGVSQGTINRYARGLRFPRPKHMEAIERVTQGRVTSADMFQFWRSNSATERRANVPVSSQHQIAG